ncbi:ArsR/SmtB family transcription factor [Candidatus Seongchinamella marina]|nr:metalloregulator ArsR/SmtB family transcription factor [Candidatus Seongchinamella marina]
MATRKSEVTVMNLEEMAEHADEAIQLLKALSNRSRLMVLCILSDGELSVGELLERVPLSQSALSQHLAVLRRDELVATRREAQTVFYSLQDENAARVVSLLHEMYCEPT